MLACHIRKRILFGQAKSSKGPFLTEMWNEQLTWNRFVSSVQSNGHAAALSFNSIVKRRDHFDNRLKPRRIAAYSSTFSEEISEMMITSDFFYIQ